MRNPPPRLLGVLATGLLTFAVATDFACSSPLSLDNLPCPCADGFVCCEATNVCVDDEARCESPELPARESIASAQEPRCLAQDDQYLYWMNEGGEVAGASKSDGSGRPFVSRLSVPSQATPHCSIVVDDDVLYATLYGAGAVLALSTPRHPGGLGAVGATFGTLLTPTALVADDEFLYVAEYDSGQIKRLPKVSPPPTTLDGDAGADASVDASADASAEASADAGADASAPGGGGLIHVDAEATVLGQGGLHPHTLLADAEFLYWLDDGGVRKMSKQGGSIVTLAPLQSQDPPTIAPTLVEGVIYWVSEGTIQSISVEGGSPRSHPMYAPEKLANDGFVEAIPVDGRRKLAVGPFFTDGLEVTFTGQDAVWQGELERGSVRRLFQYREDSYSSSDEARTLFRDATRVYWSDETSVWSHSR